SDNQGSSCFKSRSTPTKISEPFPITHQAADLPSSAILCRDKRKRGRNTALLMALTGRRPKRTPDCLAISQYRNRNWNEGHKALAPATLGTIAMCASVGYRSDSTKVHRVETEIFLFCGNPRGTTAFRGNHSGHLRPIMTEAAEAVAWLEAQTSCAEI